MPELELFAWGEGLGLPSFDPFCLSIAAYLNLAGADWSFHECRTPSISPSGELPVLRAGVEPVVGTSNIIHTLQSKGLDMDSELSPLERAESKAFISLIEDNLYDALLYTWWMENENYTKSIHPTLTGSLTFFGRYNLPPKLKERAKIRLQSYRMLDYKGEKVPEVYIAAREAYRALADKLGDKNYFYGDSPSTLDAIAFGHLSLHAYPSLAVPKLFSLLAFEFPTLIAYCARLKEKIFPDPLILSPSTHPSIGAVVSDFYNNPGSYLRLVWEGVQTRMVPKTRKQTKEQRVQAFWKGVSITGAVVFFLGFVFVNGIVEIDTASYEDDSDEADDEGSSE
ncbi:hypothetical protein BASA50_007452 [Batrachochytrium salamandrivorans]|uniref:GST C-terminal domain-containing protein n=1 Tax=Batrachochytrium salamandrivorans TaxID=1357716 RepID=A0ABQ8F6S5_9FUNG|nr:hypothetical protein BASA62_008821 [Batrachochytrium salamandrivorans]KAH6586312.1 hypothetical protein BASA61_006602 [Batrachochytrium salamandrivorans]KAH6593245.1 hypothetical protein BASA50_007452 [Batrachochytrium salamandrivorans]KAH9274147.1 hypothetical protein BASA83_003450 [Batrachochytrium salamandrivorans]KAJ1343062.1 hypothetical protein BSLG_002088 [Batrachochytrium salamandrivorans]